MKKQLKRLMFVFLFVSFAWFAMIFFEHEKLQNELIRLHIVAQSDSEEDQSVKLRVRDAILENLRDGVSQAADIESAEAYLSDMLPQIENLANHVLEKAGFDQRVSVSLDWENFPKRVYDTFALPSGIYRSLRVVIGEGEGHNWWCVVFPQLCLPASSEEFSSKAVDAGLSEYLVDTLTGKKVYRLNFYSLELLGKLENFLFPS